jgi:hypothetical protein
VTGIKYLSISLFKYNRVLYLSKIGCCELAPSFKAMTLSGTRASPGRLNWKVVVSSFCGSSRGSSRGSSHGSSRGSGSSSFVSYLFHLQRGTGTGVSVEQVPDPGAGWPVLVCGVPTES